MSNGEGRGKRRSNYLVWRVEKQKNVKEEIVETIKRKDKYKENYNQGVMDGRQLLKVVNIVKSICMHVIYLKNVYFCF